MNPNDPALTTTKREYFAVMVLQGFCANQSYNEETFSGSASMAVQMADALIKELSK